MAIYTTINRNGTLIWKLSNETEWRSTKHIELCYTLYFQSKRYYTFPSLDNSTMMLYSVLSPPL